MICRTLIIGLLLLNTALFAADADPSLIQMKSELRAQLIVSTSEIHGSLQTICRDMEDIIFCMKPFETLIDEAKSTEQCNLIQQKLDFAKTIIRNRKIFVHGHDHSSVYNEIIPKLLDLKELSSTNDMVIDPKAWPE